MKLSDVINQAKQLASVFPNGGPLEDLFTEWSSGVYRLEAEITELRERANEAEHSQDACIKVCDKLRDINAELREQLAASEKERDEWIIRAGQYSPSLEEAELARLKSHEGQWAVTISGMDEKRAHQLIRYIDDWPHNADKHYAVPLHAPADGPWVVRDNNDGTFIESCYDGNDEWNWTIHLKRAKRMTLIDAEKAAELSQDYKAVRLADVEREGE